MRRLTAIAVSITLVLAVPVVVAAPADAATGSLTVFTLDRHGRSVRSWAEVVNVVNNTSYQLTGGRAKRLPRGTYDVAAAISDRTDLSETVGTGRVTVGGTATLTIDARRGHLVRANLRPAPPVGYQLHFWAAVCPGRDASGVLDYTDEGALYAIPTTRKEFEFAFSAVWMPPIGSNGSGAQYLAAGVYRAGIPGTISRTFRQSDLTTLTVSGRVGQESGGALVQVQGDAGNDCRVPTLQLLTQTQLPYSVTFHLTPGPWSVSQSAQSYVFGHSHDYRAGHRYRVTIGRAAWGPDGNLPYTEQYSHRLIVSNMGMFSDPALRDHADAFVHYRVTHAGRVLADRTVDPDVSTVFPRLPGRGWYSVSATATPRPSAPLAPDALSRRSSVHLHFYADPSRTRQIRAFTTQFRPSSLDAHDRASGRTTTVEFRPQRWRSNEPEAKRLPDAVRRLTAWFSTDDGRTWRAVKVLHSNGRWTAVVTNPASGYVALRATVVDTHGDTATTSVIRAYGAA